MLASVSGGWEGCPGKPLTRSISLRMRPPLFAVGSGNFSKNQYSNHRFVSTASQLELLTDPARLRLVRRLARGPASLTELAKAAGVHANTARPHVAALEAGGAVVRETDAPRGRGRPPIRYRLANGWRLPTADLRGLSELLAAFVSRLGPDRRKVESFGRDWGRFLAGRPGRGDLSTGLAPALEGLGFDTAVSGRKIELSSCPCPLVSPEQPELVCRLATGVVDGMASADGQGLRVTESAHDPDQRRCSITLATGDRRRAT